MKKVIQSILRNETGMTVVEIVIASALAIVLALGIASIMRNQSTQSKQLSNLAEQNQFQNSFRQSMTNLDTYRKTFNITPGPSPSPSSSP